MIDFASITALEIPAGVVTQVEDEAGNVLWAMPSAANPIVLEVEKITSDTYAGSTTYTGENFVLLDIYPKNSNSVVLITYGGVTKVLTFNGTNAQQIYFGTFNGVSDSVETPTNGELIIEGECSAFAIGTFKIYENNKATTNYCSCITNIIEWGSVTEIVDYAFYECSKLPITKLPDGITSIGAKSFYACYGIMLCELPDGVTSIGDNAFEMPTSDLSNIAMIGGTLIFPKTVESIGNYAFRTGVSYGNGYVSYLAGIRMLPENPPIVQLQSFSGERPWEFRMLGAGSSQKMQIIVNKGCSEAYKAAEIWADSAISITEET